MTDKGTRYSKSSTDEYVQQIRIHTTKWGTTNQNKCIYNRDTHKARTRHNTRQQRCPFN
jgi:hypothetical protein